MPYPSLIDIVDTLSPLFTLGFGVFCAVNDTKPKDGKLSKAGKIALWGLIISGSITFIVKGNNLRVRLKEEEAKTIAQEKERVEKAHADSVNAAFEKATGDTLSRSVKELNNIKSASKSTLQSLNVVADKQQAALENTRRGLNPLFPLQVSLDFFIDMKEFYKQNPSLAYKKDIDLYLDTLVYFATKAKIPDLVRASNHTGSTLDTINIPEVTTVDPLQNHTYFSIPDDVNRRFDYSKSAFEGLFVVQAFTINIRKNNGSTSQLTLSFSLRDLIQKILKGEASEEENNRLAIYINIKTGIMHVEIFADNPAVTSIGSADDFISLYDLQNSIMGISFEGLVNAPAILRLNEISIYNGYHFSRKTSYKFTGKDIQEVCCQEVYARKVKAEEIK